MIKLLRKHNVVGISLLKDKVYLTQPDVKVMNSGMEYEVIGQPTPFIAVADIIALHEALHEEGAGSRRELGGSGFTMPYGCSPHFGSVGKYYTANHCIPRDSNTVDLIDRDLKKVGTANVIKKHKWKKFGFFCFLLSVLTKKMQCINEDWAVLDAGNDGDKPIGVLSGGTVPPGYTFIAPLVENPEKYVGSKVTGIAFDYDARDYHICICDIFDYGVVKYVIGSEWYFVRVWYAKGFSKPGFSGTNIYPLISTQHAV